MRLRLICLLAASLLPVFARAQAPVSHFTTEGIELDGNYVNDGAAPGEDWFPNFPPFRDPIAQDDDTLCGTSPAPKNDLTNAYVANNFDYLYMGMDRRANTGNTSFFFSFDITGDGPSVGDFVFVFCFGSGDTVTETYVLEWNEALQVFQRDATPPRVDFAVNTLRALAPFGALDRHGRPTTTIDPGKFGEARVTLADIEGFDPCAADDVTLEIQTKSSCSLSSQCKDTTGPLGFSFTPLTAALEVSQPAGCVPEIVATAHAVSPRAGSIQYRWFLDGEDITDRDPSWATSDSIVIPLADQCGPVEIGVSATDGTCTVEDAQEIDVNRQPVAGIATATVDPCTGVLSYSGASSTDCGGAALTYAWDFDSDGIVDSTLAEGTHAYAGSCGDRLIMLRVADGECESEPAQADVHVNAPPEAGLSVEPSADHCLEIAFQVTSTDCDLTASSPAYPESLSSVTSFGDGATTTDLSGVHRYAACGAYSVTTTTRDASGCESSLTRLVIVDVVAEVE